MARVYRSFAAGAKRRALGETRSWRAARAIEASWPALLRQEAAPPPTAPRALARFPLGRNRSGDKKSRQINMLDRIL